MDVNVRDLRYFVAVADELSFTRAASRLYISQPALSKQIRQLEKSLRTNLFDRDRHGVALTAAGHALLPHARTLIEQWDGARQAVAEAAASAETTLTVGFQTSIGRGLIAGVTAAMGEQLPEWRLLFRQIPWSEPTTGLGDGTTDVAVAWLPAPRNGELSWQVIAREERWVALPAGHRLAGRATVPFHELETEPFVALPASAGGLRDFWLATDSRETPARIAVEAESAEETFEAVGAGLGVALLAAGNVASYPREDVICLPVTGISSSELAVGWRTGDSRPAVCIFVNACLRLCHDTAHRPIDGQG